ncbi:conserved hypothetical protein (putative transposase or invertase) [Pseudobutyrivibrio sp. 49]|uniref:Rpn family recombination-promoting nuclease/putative transposase n=1 Tax=Pseudobutyrivibrio sp. 49 TaxID=1855344 RepID=UPI000890B83B|nr:Rpn family recombination-promoting nuclease/putative transposase [Pseudobutyrivibrio sp. 49]SDI39633.1 conserved hypothetical protein (putative transposase or invertase) [Pseudobutyrivibrio sp. 49]
MTKKKFNIEEETCFVIPDGYPSGDTPLEIPMTNDYLFKALLQENNNVLKGLIGALLHLKPDTIQSATIENSIILGQSISEKQFVLDIKVLLNNSSIIELEMQVVNEHNWPERSLAYLGREFAEIAKGGKYINIRPVHQIGILDFTLFEDALEFYSTYKMKNVKNGRIYSDKFTISVLDLKQIELATDEDKEYKIDHWAKLFSAKCWEEIYMLAKENPIIADATETLHYLTGDELIREQCFWREEELISRQNLTEALDEAKAELEEKDAIIAELKRQLAEKE